MGRNKNKQFQTYTQRYIEATTTNNALDVIAAYIVFKKIPYTPVMRENKDNAVVIADISLSIAENKINSFRNAFIRYYNTTMPTTMMVGEYLVYASDIVFSKNKTVLNETDFVYLLQKIKEYESSKGV